MNKHYAATIFFVVIAVLALWFINKPAWADVEIKHLDIGTRMHCTGDTVEDLVSECKAAMKKLCPSGGWLSDVEENPADAIPREILFTLKCKSPSGI